MTFFAGRTLAKVCLLRWMKAWPPVNQSATDSVPPVVGAPARAGAIVPPIMATETASAIVRFANSGCMVDLS